MTATHISPPYAALATGLNEAVAEARETAALAPQLGERTTLKTWHVIGVHSVAEVDGLAAAKGARAAWTAPWTYSASWTRGTVTVTVEFTADPPATPADAALIEVPGRAA